MAHDRRENLYLRGIERFNGGEYFESHEVWEELWIDEKGERRRFFQGLIQAAVALYHLENGNAIGSRKLLESSAAYLRVYRPSYLGLDVDRFLAEMRVCFDRNIDVRRGSPGRLTNQPEIELAAPPSQP